MRDGPATFLAAAPVATKMPAPITAPIPRAVSCTGPRTRFSWAPSASVRAATSGFLANSPPMPGPSRVVTEMNGPAAGRGAFGVLLEPRLGGHAFDLECGVLLPLPAHLGRLAAGLALLHGGLLRGTRRSRPARGEIVSPRPETASRMV